MSMLTITFTFDNQLQFHTAVPVATHVWDAASPDFQRDVHYAVTQFVTSCISAIAGAPMSTPNHTRWVEWWSTCPMQYKAVGEMWIARSTFPQDDAATLQVIDDFTKDVVRIVEHTPGERTRGFSLRIQDLT